MRPDHSCIRRRRTRTNADLLSKAPANSALFPRTSPPRALRRPAPKRTGASVRRAAGFPIDAPPDARRLQSRRPSDDPPLPLRRSNSATWAMSEACGGASGAPNMAARNGRHAVSRRDRASAMRSAVARGRPAASWARRAVVSSISFSTVSRALAASRTAREAASNASANCNRDPRDAAGVAWRALRGRRPADQASRRRPQARARPLSARSDCQQPSRASSAILPRAEYFSRNGVGSRSAPCDSRAMRASS